MAPKNPPAIAPALDLPIADAVELVKKLKPVEDKIVGYKVGSLHALTVGLKAAVSELKQFTDLPIIYDHQKGSTDVPSVVEKQVKAVADSGCDAFIAVPLGAGKTTLEKFVEACGIYNLEPIVLLEMTHPGANDFLKENTPKMVFDKAKELGIRYFVCPGNKYDKLAQYREWVGPDAFVCSPGIGAQGGQAQKAVKNGVDFPIVGRAIYQADDPVASVNELYEQAKRGYESR